MANQAQPSFPTSVGGPSLVNTLDVLNLHLTRQEERLQSIIDKLPPMSNTPTSLPLLEVIQKQLSSGPSKADFLWNCFLQILAAAFAIAFGVFSALAYISAQVADAQSMDANQIALLSLCLGGNFSEVEDVCAELLQRKSQILLPMVSTVIASPTSTEGGIMPSATSVVSHDSSMTKQIRMGLGIIASIIALIGICSSFLMYQWSFVRTMRKERRRGMPQ